MILNHLSALRKSASVCDFFILLKLYFWSEAENVQHVNNYVMIYDVQQQLQECEVKMLLSICSTTHITCYEYYDASEAVFENVTSRFRIRFEAHRESMVNNLGNFFILRKT